MGSAQLRSGGALCALTAFAALTGCVAASPDDGPQGALFKAQVGDISGGVAPGPHSVWYVQRQPLAYVKMGFATWQPERTHGPRAWIARYFRHRAPADADAEAKGVAAANLGLPVPSRVQVTNVASGQVIIVRVDDKVAMTDAILKLTPEAARSLGADPGKPLLIRIRYLSPVVAYNDAPALHYAFRAAPRQAPPAAVQPAAPTMIAANPPRPELIRVVENHTTLAVGIAPALRSMLPLPTSAPEPAATRFRVQAGAFASLSNAHQAVNRLEPAGGAVIEPVQNGATTLYRVIVPGPRDAAAAERLRARVTQIGFADARLLRPL